MIHPEWVPVSPDGTDWKLFSHKGRFLGVILKVDGRWLAHKFCCDHVKTYDRMSSASCYVESTLSCSECVKPWLVYKSN